MRDIRVRRRYSVFKRAAPQLKTGATADRARTNRGRHNFTFRFRF
ncbi:MAG: hypothetical protein V7641_2555 [Blastocatellia bacterium]